MRLFKNFSSSSHEFTGASERRIACAYLRRKRAESCVRLPQAQASGELRAPISVASERRVACAYLRCKRAKGCDRLPQAQASEGLRAPTSGASERRVATAYLRRKRAKGCVSLPQVQASEGLRAPTSGASERRVACAYLRRKRAESCVRLPQVQASEGLRAHTSGASERRVACAYLRRKRAESCVRLPQAQASGALRAPTSGASERRVACAYLRRKRAESCVRLPQVQASEGLRAPTSGAELHYLTAVLRVQALLGIDQLLPFILQRWPPLHVFGPSASAAVLCAVVSLFTNRLCRSDTAVTARVEFGTDELFGVGFLAQKAWGARKAELTRLVMSTADQDAWAAVPAAVREGLTPVFVGTGRELLDVMFKPLPWAVQ
ncbi:hypothetical protein niasHS_000829 [Heterodera schachtii]|uniref:Lon proteolytic domain-containing protein n=1 Tax=Heterodera schachtii TaxID=97005 RepID=A0ABD2KLK6_HETSC